MDERDPLLNRLRPIAIPEGERSYKIFLLSLLVRRALFVCSQGCVKPHARSGHRSVANQSALYVFGGYHGDGHKLFREVAFSLNSSLYAFVSSSNAFLFVFRCRFGSLMFTEKNGNAYSAAGMDRRL